MPECKICNHCGMCVSKQKAPTAIPHGNGMISMDSNIVEENCDFCATPLDGIYN